MDMYQENHRTSYYGKDFKQELGFERQENGDVRVFVEKTDISFTIPSNEWVSIILNMTEFDEQSGYWHSFMDHHMGNVDVLSQVNIFIGEKMFCNITPGFQSVNKLLDLVDAGPNAKLRVLTSGREKNSYSRGCNIRVQHGDEFEVVKDHHYK